MLTVLSFYLYPGWYLLQGQSRGRNTRNCLSNPTYFSLRSQNDKKTCRKSEIWDKLLPKIQKMSQNFPLSESPRMSPVYMYLVIKNQNLQPSDPIWSVEHFLYLANSLATKFQKNNSVWQNVPTELNKGQTVNSFRKSWVSCQ